MKKLLPFIIVILVSCSNQHIYKMPRTESEKNQSKIESGQETPMYNESRINEKEKKTEGLLNLNTTETPNIHNIDLQNKMNSGSHPSTRKPSTLNKKVLLKVPMVNQMPELYNGCEIASLAMMLQHAGVKVNKFDVAKNIPKDNDPLIQHPSGDVIHWGNPNHGFVGSITGEKAKGYGVYHKPMQRVIEHYLPKRSINLSGQPFEKIEEQIRSGKPVVVLTTTSFTPPKKWDTWKHGKETIKGTNELHAVVVVGYDEKSVYINDPYTGEKSKKIMKKPFVNSWTSLGKQAVSYR